MSTTVDERVVSMRFDNQHFEKNVQTSLSTIEKLKQKLNFKDAAKGLESVNAAAKNVDLSGMGSAVDAVRVKFSGLEVMAMTALSNITNSALNAGKRIAAAFTVEPIRTGFQEYETQINAVQTILANTSSKGTTLEDVNQALDELNHYADMTIYNFTEMTRNIGTFTAAGVDLKTSVSAIQGIANLAAVSGSTSQQASTAMYQLSQALAAGTVKLMDWNSVVNAGMGGEVFQNALKETARLHGVAIDQMIEKEGSFRETLQSGWLTSELLTETLSKFTTTGVNEYLAEYTGKSADAIAKMREQAAASGDMDAAYREMAKSLSANSKLTEEQVYELLNMSTTAEDAATKVKTFSQLMDTLKEAAQSGWTQTWEILIGDFEEAKELFTEVSDTFGKMIEKSANARNSLLEGAMSSGWEQIQKQAEDAGIAADSFQNALKETARAHGVAIDDMIAKEGSFEKTLKSGWLTSGMIAETLRGYIGSAAGAAEATGEVTDRLSEFQDVVNQVIRGNFGNGEDRVKALTEAGYDYATVQGLVNQVLSGGTAEVSNLSDAQLENIGYTEEQVAAIRKLAEQAEKTGTPLNELISQMAKPSGRELLIDSFRNALKGILKVIEAVKGAWRDVFPAMTSNQLYSIIEGLHSFSKHLVVTDGSADKLRRSLKGLFAILDIILTVTGGAFRIALKVIGSLLGMVDLDILSVTAAVSDAVVAFHDWLFENSLIARGIQALAGILGQGVSAVAGWVKGFMALPVVQKHIAGVQKAFSEASGALRKWMSEHDLVTEGFSKLASGISYVIKMVKGWIDGFLALPIVQRNVARFGEAFSSAFKGLGGYLEGGVERIREFIQRIRDMKSINVSDIGAIFKDFRDNVAGYFLDMGGRFEKIKEALRGFREDVRECFHGAGEIIGGFADEVGGAVGSVGKLISDNLGAIVTVGIGVGMIASFSKMGKALEKIAHPLEAVSGVITKFVGSVSGALKAYTMNIKADAMYKIAKAIAALVGSIVLLTLLDQENLWSAVGVLGAIGIGLVGLTVALDKLTTGNTLKDSGNMIKQMGNTVLKLSVAVALLSKLNPDGVNMAIVAIDSLMWCFGGIIALSQFAGPYADYAGIMISKMSTGILKLSIAIALLSKLKPAGVIGAIAAIDSLLICFRAIIFLSFFAGDNADKAGTMIQKMSTGILMISVAIALLSKLDARGVIGALAAIDSLLRCFEAIIILSLLAGDNADKAGIMLQKMSVGILLLSVSIALLSKLNAGGIFKAIVAIDALMLCFAGLVAVSKFAGEHADKAGKMLLSMSAAILILSVAIGLLSTIKPEGLWQAVGAIAVLEVLFAGLIASTKLAKKCKSTIMMIAVVVGMLSVALVGLSLLDPENLAAATASLSAVMVAFSAMIASTSLAKGGKKSLATIAVMTLVVGALGGILYLLAGLPVESTLGIAASLSILILSLSGACVLLGVAGKFGSAAFVGIGALVALIAAVGTLMAAIGALVTEIPEVEKWLDAGLPVLEKIGYGLGSFFGNIIGGFAAGATSGLPKIGMNLSNFMVSLMPFLMGIKMVTPEAMQGVKALAETVLILTAADLVNGIASFITGGSSLVSFAEQLAPFGEAIVRYSRIVKGAINEEAVTASANAGKALAELATNLPNSGGVLGWWLGENDIDDFADKIVPFGKAIVRYSRVVKGAINEDAVVASANAGKALADLASSLPNSGGALGWWLGDNNIDDFGNKIVTFGKAIVRYSRIVKCAVSEDAVKSSTNAGKALAELADCLPNNGGALGWWLGENGIDDFGNKIIPFGKAIVRYSRIVKCAVSEDAVKSSTNAGKALAALAKEIPNSGGIISLFTGNNNIDRFAEKIVPFGKAIAEYSEAVEGNVKPEAVEASVNAGKALAGLASAVPESGGLLSLLTGNKSLGTFGTNLKSFGGAMKDYYDSVSGIVGTNIYMAVSAANSIVNMAKGISNIDTAKMNTFGSALRNLGQSGIDEFVRTFSESGDDVENAVSSMAKFFTQAVEEKKASLAASARGMVNAFIIALRSQYKGFFDAGGYLVGGFVRGISTNMDSVKTKAVEMANAAKDAANRTLEINSPSKVFEQIGAYVVQGFAQGISKNAWQAAKSAEALAQVGERAARIVADSLNRGSKVFDEFVEKTDEDGNQLELTLERAAEAFKKFRDSVKDSIKDAMGVFDEWEEESDMTGKQLMENLENQILGIQEWADNVQRLAQRGMSESLLKALTDMGTSGAKYINALVKLSDNELRKLNDLYSKRLRLNGKAANQIAASFLEAGTKAANAFRKGLENPIGLAAKIKDVVSKRQADMIGGIPKGIKEVLGKTKISDAMLWSFEKDAAATKAGLDYGKGAFQAFVDGYLTSVKNAKAGSSAISKASKALTVYGKKLYEESDYYEEDTANIKEHKKELSDLQTKRDKIQKKLKKAQKSNTAASKKRVKELKSELSETDKSIKEAKKRIKQDKKDVAAHTKEVFNEMRTGIADSVAAFIDPLKASLDTGIDLFEKFATEARKVSTEKLLRNMKSQVEGVTKWQEDMKKLEKRGVADGLLQKLKDMGPEGAKYVDAFLRMTSQELAEANETFAKSEGLTSQTLMANFTDSLDTASKWADSMQKLAEMGFSQSLLESLGDMGVDGMEYVNAFLSMTPKQVTQFNKKYEKSLKLPNKAADKVISSFVYAGGESVKGFTQALENLAKAGTQENEEFLAVAGKIAKMMDEALKKTEAKGKKAGKNAAKGVSDGMESKAASVKKVAADLGSGVVSAISGIVSIQKGAEISKNICVGMEKGFKANAPAVSSAASQAALKAYGAAADALEIHSPSRKFEELGMFSDEGFAMGIEAGAGDVCATAVREMGKAIDTVAEAVDSGIDIQPTVRPVIDLSDIQNGAGRIREMMDGYSVSGSMRLAQMAAGGMPGMGSRAESEAVWGAIDSLKETLKGLAGSSGDTYNNTFHIQGSSPKEIADEVSHIIQQQVERRRAAWG